MRYLIAVIIALGLALLSWALRPQPSHRDGFIQPSPAESEVRR